MDLPYPGDIPNGPVGPVGPRGAHGAPCYEHHEESMFLPSTASNALESFFAAWHEVKRLMYHKLHGRQCM